MNRKLFFLSVLFCWLLAAWSFGQPKLSVSATVVPTLTYTAYKFRFLYPDSDGQIVEPVYLNGPRWASGYSAGLSVIYTYAPGWSVSSGIWYQQLTTRQARQAAAGEGMVTLRNRFIRLPLLLNYCASTKRLAPCFSFGLLTDIPVPSRVVVTRTGASTQHLRLETNSRPIFHLLLGAGVQYRLNARYLLMAHPAWTYRFGQLGGASINDPSFGISLLTQVAYVF